MAGESCVLRDFPVESLDLFQPELDELSKVLRDGLSKNFADVDVSVVDCPNLQESPWNLAASGICGKPKIADIGGPPYLLPLPQLNKVYDMNVVAEKAGIPGGFLIGAGAGSHSFVGVNSEMMANIQVASKENEKPVNKTRISKVNPEDGSCILQDCDCSQFALMANLLMTEGKPGKVVRAKASKRTGNNNFITAMRLALAEHYGSKTVGLGGVFLIEKGKAKFHVMPQFQEKPLNTDEDVNSWLKFYDMKSPLVCVGVFESHDPGLDLRIEHFHGYGNHGEGGHYHYDTTPDEVQYVGYFTTAERLFRMDKPQVQRKFGSD
ncbi:ester hydrolase C11orf54 homolog [Actinia tenebrosa]|uniref:Ester hydrolase C11orf54 homolog n=1 Tax=Actinia tenebrosa TaxID=6105 RepID=A0A6P8H9Y2_ACTTE|nr:ester hydrolase C11orf54 homolog [Actinia tenebrosa]